MGEAELREIRAILERDRGWAAYALADLAPPYSAHAEWRRAPDGHPALLLLYRRFDPPVLFAMGAPADLEPLVSALSEPAVCLSVRAEVLDLLRRVAYRVSHEKPMLRMLFDAHRFQASASAGAVRLGPPDHDELMGLYADGEPASEAPDFFHASMLDHGVYFGIREGGELVAAAGTHVLAPEEGIGGLGNVYTRRDRRGRGYGSQATAAVTAELLRLGIRAIALNVAQRNAPAIRVYEKLGFAACCQFREGIAAR